MNRLAKEGPKDTCLSSVKDGQVVVTVKVTPRASISRVEKVANAALKVRLAAPPVDGAANAELVKTMASFFGVAKSAVVISSGESSRTKRVSIRNVTLEEAIARLALLS